MAIRVTENVYDFDMKTEEITTTYDDGSYIHCSNTFNEDNDLNEILQSEMDVFDAEDKIFYHDRMCSIEDYAEYVEHMIYWTKKFNSRFEKE